MDKKKLLELLAAKAKEQQGMVDKAKTDGRDVLTEDEIKSFNDLQKEIDNIKVQIKSAEAYEETQKYLDEPVSNPVIPVNMDTQEEKLDDCGFKNIGEFLNAVKAGGDKEGRLKSLSSSDAGILIPPQFSQNIMRLDPEAEIIMPRSTNIPAGSPPDAPFTIPYFQQGSDGANGGIILTWTDEEKTVTDTKDPVIKDMTLQPHEVSGMATINNKTLENWGAAGTFVEMLLRQAYAGGRDYKMFHGSGAGCPLGILKAPGAIVIGRNTSTTFKYIDAVTMLSRLLPEAMSKALWTISITLMPDVVTMKDDANNLIFVQGDATRGIPPTLLGIPIKWTGKLPTKGNQGDVMLSDYSYYMTKSGSGPYVAISEHVKFTTNKTVFKIVSNSDGQPWVKEPLLLEDGSTTVSPYIILK